MVQNEASQMREVSCCVCGTEYYDTQWIIAEEFLEQCKSCFNYACYKCMVENEFFGAPFCKNCWESM